MIYVILYLTAIVLANLLVAWFGPSISILNAFLFIGLDLTARDALHEQWKHDRLFLKMTALILVGSIISWLLNRNADTIAVASFVAFATAAAIDSLSYHWLRDYPRWFRINGSNLPSALADSIIFPILAFGWPPLWGIMAGQFVAKVAGGLLWSIVLARYWRTTN